MGGMRRASLGAQRSAALCSLEVRDGTPCLNPGSCVEGSRFEGRERCNVWASFHSLGGLGVPWAWGG